MTLEEYAMKYMTSRGMDGSDAKTVLDTMKQDKAAESVAGRWNDESGEYSNPVLISLMILLDTFVLEWIDKNKPKAWYRPMFNN